MKKEIKLKHTEDFFLKKLLAETKIKEIMTPNPVCIDVKAHFTEVPKKMNQLGIRHLPVTDKDKNLLGIITQRDFFRICPPHKLLDGTWANDKDFLDGIVLEHAMIQKPFSMKANESMGDALVYMVEKEIGCIPVVDKNNKIEGIITRVDLLKVAKQIYQE